MNAGEFQTQETMRIVTQQIKTLEEEKKKNHSSKKFMKNIIMLIVAQVLVKVLGLIYRVVIVNIPGFGDKGNGYYSTGYEVYAVMLTISSIGIPSVIAKLVSERIAIGDKKGANRIFKVALALFGGIGLVFTGILFFGADFISETLLNVKAVAPTLRFLAPAIVFVSIAAVIRGYFTGLEDMKPTSISQTLEQFLNCILTIVMIYAVAGSSDAPTMAAAGNLAGTISIILAFIYIVLYYERHKVKVRRYDKSVEDNKSTKEIIKTILALSIPITIGSLISVLNTFIDTTTVSNGIQDAFKNYILDKGQLEQKAMEMKGILSKVNTIVGLPQAVNIAIGTALVPSISGFLAKKEFEQAKKMMKKSMNISLFIVMPSVVGLFVLSEPLLKVMYPHAYKGSELMMLLCIPTLFICLNHTVNRWITRSWRCNNSINCSVCRSSYKDSYEFNINKNTKH